MRSGLRIAAVVSYFPTRAEPHAGMPFFNQMRAMAAIGEVKIFVVRPRYPEVPFLRPKSFLDSRVDPDFTIPGMDITYITYPALPAVSRPFNGASCARRLLPAVRGAGAGVVLSYIVYPVGYAAVRVARQLGLPVVVGATGSDVRRIPDPWTRRLVKATLREADFVVAKSAQLRGEVVRLGAAPEKTAAIRNGCDGTVFYPGDRAAARRALGVGQGARLIVFTGRLVAVKGVQELIAALQQLRSRDGRVEVALIGDGPLEAGLRCLCESQGLAGAVRFLGALSQREVARWLTAGDVFCLPSYSEGCPNVVLEALACGRPVVATNVGGVPEITGSSCAILVPPADAGALAEALRRALDFHWDEAAIAATSGRTWADMARETHRVCAAVAAGDCAAAGLAEAPAA